jgi:upstream activation factor subunit UAF30
MRNNAAFMKPVQPDAVLGAIVGTQPLPRSEITKRLWEHIKAHGLQDATNRRQINAGATMRPLFDGKGSVTMFELPKCVSCHLITAEG